MSDWKPKVGGECLCHIRGGQTCDKIYKKGVISFIGTKYIVFTDENGREYPRRKNKVDIKPLPTEEEKLIDEFVKDYRYIAYPADCDFKEMAECIARAMINKGYRKVEPISRDEFLKISRDLSVNLYDYLIDNNHIVVKGE